MKLSRWSLDEIVVNDRIRKRLQEGTVSGLMESIQNIGLREPPTIRIEHDEEEDGGEFPVLITGLHRIEALKRLGAKYVDCVVFDGDETEARLWEISENLHRAELTELEWSEHVAEWKRLAEQKEAEGISEQNVQKIAKDGTARGRPEGGTAKAARELPIPGPTENAKRMAVMRAVKIADITPEAKEAVKAAGLDNKKTVLLHVADAKTADDQLATVHREHEQAEKRKQLAEERKLSRRQEESVTAAHPSASPSEEEMFAWWLMERMGHKEKPKIISWLKKCEPNDVIAAIRRKVA